MADRSFHKPETQGVRHVQYDCTIEISSGAPVFVEGDLEGEAEGSYLELADTGTGQITVSTTDKFLGSVSCVATRNSATAALDKLCSTGVPTQNADGTWSVLILTGANSAGTFTEADMAAGDTLSLHWVLRNSTVKP
jgi:hypothetical protein